MQLDLAIKRKHSELLRILLKVICAFVFYSSSFDFCVFWILTLDPKAVPIIMHLDSIVSLLCVTQTIYFNVTIWKFASVARGVRFGRRL